MLVMISFKDLAFALLAEGRFAELNGDTNSAAEKYLHGIRFGVESSRGGVMISKLVGIACEGGPGYRLKFVLPSLDARMCGEMARGLEKIDAGEESVEEIVIQERAWFFKATTVREKIESLMEFKTERGLKNSFIKTVHKNTLLRRQLMIAFAARAYELKKGAPPQNVADLVPNYLKSIPKDPATGTNLVYSR